MFLNYVLLFVVLVAFLIVISLLILFSYNNGESESEEEILESYAESIRKAAEMGRISKKEAEKAIEALEETKKKVANKATIETDTYTESEKVTVIVPDNVKNEGHIISTQKMDAKEFEVERKKVGSGAVSKDQMSAKDDMKKSEFYAESNDEGE